MNKCEVAGVTATFCYGNDRLILGLLFAICRRCFLIFLTCIEDIST